MTVPVLPPWRETFAEVRLPDGTLVPVIMSKTWRAYFEQLDLALRDHEARIVVLEP